MVTNQKTPHTGANGKATEEEDDHTKMHKVALGSEDLLDYLKRTKSGPGFRNSYWHAFADVLQTRTRRLESYSENLVKSNAISWPDPYLLKMPPYERNERKKKYVRLFRIWETVSPNQQPSQQKELHVVMKHNVGERPFVLHSIFVDGRIVKMVQGHVERVTISDVDENYCRATLHAVGADKCMGLSFYLEKSAIKDVALTIGEVDLQGEGDWRDFVNQVVQCQSERTRASSTHLFGDLSERILLEAFDPANWSLDSYELKTWVELR